MDLDLNPIVIDQKPITLVSKCTYLSDLIFKNYLKLAVYLY